MTAPTSSTTAVVITPAWLVLTGRILEIAFGVAGLAFLMVMAVKRETVPVPIGTVLPFPWVTISVGVGAVLPWTMGRAFARNIITGVLSKIPLPAGRAPAPESQ